MTPEVICAIAFGIVATLLALATMIQNCFSRMQMEGTYNHRYRHDAVGVLIRCDQSTSNPDEIGL